MTEPERGHIICINADGKPPLESVLEHCVKCGRALWRSIGSLNQDLDAICADCVPDDSRPGVAMPQLRQLAATWGMDLQTARSVIERIGLEIIDE